MKRTSLALLAVVLGALSPGCPARPPKTDTPLKRPPIDGTGTPADAPTPLWSAVKTGTLPNGLTYYILPHAKPENRVYLWLAVDAGSMLEDDDQLGLAHMAEHMAFNGTTHFAKSEIVDYAERIGMQFGADLNAYTDSDETVYKLEVPTDDPSFVDTGLDILRDWAGDVSYDPEEVEKERGVVLEEWRSGRGAGRRIWDKQTKVLFAGTRYAERDTIGDPKILKTASRDTLKRYYDDWYRPDLMAVIVVGEIEPAKIEQMIEAKFSDLENPAAARPRIAGGVPKADGTRFSIETDPEATQTVVEIYNTFAHRSESTEADYRRFLIDQLYQAMLNERLDILRERPAAPFVWAGANIQDLNRDTEAAQGYAGVKDGKVEEALAGLFAEVLRVERHGFLASEFERAKKQLLRGRKQAVKELEKRDGRGLVEELLRHFLQGEQMTGVAAELKMTEKFLPAITVAEVNALAAEWGGDDNRVVMLSGPSTQKMPGEARVKEVLAAVAKQDLEVWVDEATDDVLMPTKPAAGTIATETTDADHGITTWTLSNGVKVLIKPTDFENDTVLVQGFSPGGTAMASDKVFPSARFAAEVIGSGGVGKYSDTQLDKLLAGLLVDAYPWITETAEGIEASASAEDLEVAMQLVNLTMTAPRRDEQAFAVWQQSTREWVKNRRLMPEISFYEDISSVMTKGNPRRKPPEAADVDKVDLDQAMVFYRDRFGDAGDFTFVIVGNVALDKLRPLVEQYLASLPSTGRKEKEKDIGIKHPKGVTKKVVTRGQEPKSQVVLVFHGDQQWTREAELDVRTLGDVLNIRLREVLREDMGGVYGVGVWGGLSRSPRQERTFYVQFGCAPENVEKLKKAVFDEVAKIKKSGIGDTYLEKVRKGRVRSRETDLLKNGSWAGWMGEAERYGDDLSTVLDLEAELARISSANVQAAAKKFFDAKQYVFGVLVPETGEGAVPEKAPAKKKVKKARPTGKAGKPVPKESPVKVEADLPAP